MIVLGPKDADLNGAPGYWVCGNWRPHTKAPSPSGCGFVTCPFDKCDLVYEYDARRESESMPIDQGWKLVDGESSHWSHDATRGALRYQIPAGASSFWQRVEQASNTPERAVAYALFMMDEVSENNRFSGVDYSVTANASDQTRPRGIRGVWSTKWMYRSLDGSDVFPMVQNIAESELLRVWHRMALDAELTGPDIPNDNVAPRDGGKTIASLDGYINNDPRHRFGYGRPGPAGVVAEFGAMTKAADPLSGWIRNFYASFPGRFLRAGYRAVALGKTTRLRLILCVEAGPLFADGSAVFLVNYTSPSMGMKVSVLPSKPASPVVVDFNSSNAGSMVEAKVELGDLTTGEDIWFTVERLWQQDQDRQRSTVHLLMIIVDDGAS